MAVITGDRSSWFAGKERAAFRRIVADAFTDAMARHKTFVAVAAHMGLPPSTLRGILDRLGILYRR